MTNHSRLRRPLAVGIATLSLGGLAGTASAASVTTTATHTASASTTFGPLAVSCNYQTISGLEYAGHYSGVTVVPSTTQVTSSGEEAQCLLQKAGFSPGTIDGVFGSHSQAAMHNFQVYVDNNYGAGLATGPGEDLPGPKSWPWLRWFAAPDPCQPIPRCS